MAGVIWALIKWKKREEHFPRINFEMKAEVVGRRSGKLVINVTAILENVGVVPLKITDFSYELRGLRQSDELRLGDEGIRCQLDLMNQLSGGSFIQKQWDYSFVYPGVAAEYQHITIIDDDIEYMLAKGKFSYKQGDDGHSHYAGVFKKVNSND